MWAAVAALGAYHGLNPGMGWLLAVSNGLQARRSTAVFGALPPIAIGHFFAMTAALLPFTLFMLYLDRAGEIRVAAAAVLVVFGAFKLLSRRHPRFLARIRPSQLALWSFFVATAHGAGLMLVPVVLGLCTDGSGSHDAHRALRELARSGLGMTFAAVTVHTASMLLTGGIIAWVVYRYVGLRLLRSAWINVDLLWALLLIVVGVIALAAAL
ncbi:MAG TPA: hypothetical protein VF304_01960 [Casimicrobiaceae bacterium]